MFLFLKLDAPVINSKFQLKISKYIIEILLNRHLIFEAQ